jgi:hypothetical protein
MPPVLRKRKNGSGSVGATSGLRKNGSGSVGATSGLEKCECGEPIIVFQENIATVSNKEKTAKAWKEVKRALTHPETLLHTEKNSKVKSSDQQEETPVCPIGIRQCKYCLDNRPGCKGPTRARTGTRKRKHAPEEEEEAAKEYVPLSVEDREDDVRLPESLSDDDSEWVCFCKDNWINCG